MQPAMWFSVIACVVALLGPGTTELTGRRTRRLGPASVTTTLLILTAATAILVVIMGTARTFYSSWLPTWRCPPCGRRMSPWSPAGWWSGWMVVRVESRVRATALSARDMFDSGGQIVGGPVIGVVGNLVSVRAALLAGGGARPGARPAGRRGPPGPRDTPRHVGSHP